MSSPRTTAQQRPKASKANYESSQGDDQGDGQADPFRPWHHANKPGLKHASRWQNGSWPAHVRKIPVTKNGLSASVPGDLNTTPRSRLSTRARPDGLLAGFSIGCHADRNAPLSLAGRVGAEAFLAERQSTAIDGGGQRPPHHGKLPTKVRIDK
jgi:hypothetical protein